MKRLVIALLLIPLVEVSGSHLMFKADNEVFVCLSKTAHKYHRNENCKGLLKSTHEIRKVGRTEVDPLRFSACKICY